MFSIVVEHGASRLALRPILGLWETRPLKQVLDEGLSKDQPLILDAQPALRLPSACAQRLVRFPAAEEQAGLRLRLSRPSHAFLVYGR
jgi:hypothetical protein